MPSDLLQMDLPTAAITLVNRMHTARRWKWSTYAKALPNFRAALLEPPIYTSGRNPVDITNYPEWRQAVTATQRFVQETPPPTSILECQRARGHLRLSPIPSLCLGLMRAFAARAGDIGQLRVENVHVNPTSDEAATTVPVSLTIRRGSHPLTSHLLREGASFLQQLMGRQGPHQLLFLPLGPVENAVRAALRLVNPQASFPSVRSGSTRCLVDNAQTDAEVIHLSGFTRHDTLHRYMRFGRHLTAEAVTAQDNAAHALLGPNTSE
jgi:hypothetical protein